jgi:hypothetical protein
MSTIRYAFRPDEWPRPDREAWHASLVAGDLLDPDGLAAGWAPGTLVAVTTACGRWMGWLASRGALDPERSAIADMPRELMDEYVTHLRGRCAMSTVVTLLAHLVMAARAIAPNEDWSWLQRITARLKRRSRPARDKRPRLQETDDLLDLGMELMAGADYRQLAAGSGLPRRPDDRAARIASVPPEQFLFDRDRPPSDPAE